MAEMATMTNVAEKVQEAVDLLKPWAREIKTPEDGRVDVALQVEDLLAAVEALHKVLWGHLTAITGIDPGVETGEIEVIYHFRSSGAVVGLRVRTRRDSASVPSICGIIPSASFFERELREMFGVKVVGTPHPRKLFLPDDWPEGVYPLRKDFSPDQIVRQGTGDNRAAETDEKPRRFVIPIGPQHPALKEPGHFEFTVEGEIVTSAWARLGYAHRGIEKAMEERTWIQNLYLVERICGICSHVHAMTYCQGVEKLAGVEIPPRARAIRVLMAELERIHSHMLWVGVGAHEAGFETLFMYTWRDRETVMDLLEGLSGNRVNYSANVLGGVKFDVDEEQADAIREGMNFLEKRLHHYLDVVMTDESFLVRTEGIGTVTQEQAERLGTVGPTARASGVSRDVRLDAPYAAYPDLPMNIVIETEGDLLARFMVRIRELFESVRVIREILDKLPEGDLTTRIRRKIPEGEVVSCSEAPRGELFYFIKSRGDDKPYRVKVRTPTLSNWGAVLSTVVGRQLADVPMILAGVDPCFSCNDRMVRIRAGDSQRRDWTWEKLRTYGIEYYHGKLERPFYVGDLSRWPGAGDVRPGV
jgi:ech hydrogenase subunit E